MGNRDRRHRSHLMAGTAMAGAALLGLGQGAEAACVVTAPPNVFTCSGANTTGQTVSVTNATVTTDPGFSVDAASGTALSIDGLGPLSYIDTNASSLSAGDYGLAISASGNSGANPNSVIVQTDGTISSDLVGIYVNNDGTGATSITTAAAVTAQSVTGILVTNGTAGTSLALNAAAVSGGRNGIYAENNGTGATSITTTGVVSGTDGTGISVVNGVATTGGLTVNAEAAVTGGSDGIYAQNNGAGDTRITASAKVTGGIWAENGVEAKDLILESGAIEGGSLAGIYVSNAGTGATDVTVNGAVTGPNFYGVQVGSGGATTGLTLTTAEVTGQTMGITASNSGSGNTSVTTKGTVTGINDNGITVTNSTKAKDLTVIAEADVNSMRYGIEVVNYGAGGSTSITTKGTVTGGNPGLGGVGIRAQNGAEAKDLTIDVATVSGGIFALNRGTGATSVTTTGTVEGSGYAIYAQSNAGHAIDIELSGVTRGNGGTANALAIVTVGGATTLTNGGTLTGRVELGDYADLVSNNATWTTGGTSLFGAGIDSVMNATGATLVTASNGAIIETTTFNGLESLSNGGRLTMQDGGAGDRTLLSGDATLAPGSTYAIDIDAAQSDLLHANGAVTVTGSTIAVTVQDDLLVGTRYTVLTADGGLTGMFSSVTGLLETAFYTLKDAYDANNAYLDVVRARDFAEVGVTGNQIAIGGGLDSMTGGVLRGAVASLATDAEARTAFDQLSGEIHASAKGMLLNDSQFIRDAASSRIRAAFGAAGAAPLPVMAYGEGGPEAVAADTDRFAAWGQAFGSWGDTDSDGNAAAFNRSTGGLLMGTDALVGDWRIGLLGGYSRSSFDADKRKSSGDSDNYHVGLYGGTNWGAIAFRAGATYSWNAISTKRSVAFNGFADQLTADYDAGTAQVFGELAYRVDANRFKFEPFANLAYVSVHTDGFTEEGGAAALTSASSTIGATFTTLGLRASTDLVLGGMSATARAMLGWRHAFGDVIPQSSFAFTGSDAFTIAGAPIAQDAVLVEAGLDLQLTPNATLGLAYSGQFGSGVVDQGANASLGVKF